MKLDGGFNWNLILQVLVSSSKSIRRVYLEDQGLPMFHREFPHLVRLIRAGLSHLPQWSLFGNQILGRGWGTWVMLGDESREYWASVVGVRG